MVIIARVGVGDGGKDRILICSLRHDLYANLGYYGLWKDRGTKHEQWSVNFKFGNVNFFLLSGIQAKNFLYF